MRFAQLLAVTLCLATAGGVFAAEPASKPAGAILEQIPAGSMGFVVVQDVQGSTAAVDKFLQQIGEDKLFVEAPGAKNFLDLIRKEAKLGEGFDPKGGFAAVMLDLQQYGLNVATIMSGQDAKGNPIKLPFVLMVPGQSVESVFAQYPRATPEGAKYVQVKLRMGPMFATSNNGYVLLSPREDALTAVVQAKQNVTADISAANLKLIRSSAISIYMDMKVSGALLIQVIKQSEDMLAAIRAMNGGKGPNPELQTSELKKMIGNTEAILVAGQFTAVGPQLTVRVTVAKDSELGRSVATMGQISETTLSRLPNLDYIVACDIAGATMTPERLKIIQDQMDRTLAQKPFSDLPEASRAKFKKFAIGWNEQVQSAQIVMGGAPKGKGVMGMAMVIECKDAAKTKELLSDGVEVITEIVQEELKKAKEAEKAQPGDASPPGIVPFAPPVSAETTEAAPGSKPAPAPFKATYKKNATKVGSVEVDALVIRSPEIDKDQKKLVKFFGDEQIRVLIASPDNKTVVVTFGGAEDMMAATLKTATEKSGTIADKDVRTVINQLPKQRAMVALFDLANLFKMVRQVEPADKAAPVLQSHQPAAMSFSAADSSVEFIVIMPNLMIKDLIKVGRDSSKPEVPEEGESEPSTKPAKPKEDF